MGRSLSYYDWNPGMYLRMVRHGVILPVEGDDTVTYGGNYEGPRDKGMWAAIEYVQEKIKKEKEESGN